MEVLAVPVSKLDNYYMDVALLTSSRSKDPNTKVGACVADNKKVLSLGWNGPPRVFNDDELPLDCRDKTKPLREQKYPYIIHAEINSVLNYGGRLSDLEGSSLYVNVFPCSDCAKTLCQIGIKEVIYKRDYEDSDMARHLFDLAGIKYYRMGDTNE